MADQITTEYQNENRHLTAGGDFFYTQKEMLFVTLVAKKYRFMQFELASPRPSVKYGWQVLM